MTTTFYVVVYWGLEAAGLVAFRKNSGSRVKSEAK